LPVVDLSKTSEIVEAPKTARTVAREIETQTDSQSNLKLIGRMPSSKFVTKKPIVQDNSGLAIKLWNG